MNSNLRPRSALLIGVISLALGSAVAAVYYSSADRRYEYIGVIEIGQVARTPLVDSAGLKDFLDLNARWASRDVPSQSLLPRSGTCFSGDFISDFSRTPTHPWVSLRLDGASLTTAKQRFDDCFSLIQGLYASVYKQRRELLRGRFNTAHSEVERLKAVLKRLDSRPHTAAERGLPLALARTSLLSEQGYWDQQKRRYRESLDPLATKDTAVLSSGPSSLRPVYPNAKIMAFVGSLATMLGYLILSQMALRLPGTLPFIRVLREA